MKYFVILNFILITTYLGINSCYGQQVTATSGGKFESSTNQLSWTIGEPIITTIGVNSKVLTQGFQQSTLRVTSIFTLPEIDIDFSVYPNPVIEKLSIACSESSGEFLITVVDLSGKISFNKKVILGESAETIDFNDYVQGIYILRIAKLSGTIIQSYKIVKE